MDLPLHWTYLVVFVLTALSLVSLVRFLLLARLSLSRERYGKLYDAWLLLLAAALLLAIAYAGELFELELVHKGLELASLAFLLSSSLLIARVTDWKRAAPLEVVDWGEVSDRIKLVASERKAGSAFYNGLHKSIKGRNLVLVEVGKGADVLSVLGPMYAGFLRARGELYVLPVLGATAPYSIKQHEGSIGDKSGLWVSALKPEEDWIERKFTVISQSDVMELLHYIHVVIKQRRRDVVFIGDFLDEMYDQIDAGALHRMVSSISTLLKEGNAQMLLIVKSELYPAEKLAILERYSDAILRAEGRPPSLRLLGTRTDRVESLGVMPLP